MSAHAEPAASHRCHMYENLIGFLPVQLPGFAVSDCPTCSNPVIVGGETFTGPPAACAAGAIAAAVATASRANPTSFFIAPPSLRGRANDARTAFVPLRLEP